MRRMRQGELDGLYGRVLERLALALQGADAQEAGSELDIEGLTPTELALIQASLRQDARWLSGWHAAAREQALLARQTLRASVRQRLHPRRVPRPRSEPLRPLLDCALCGTSVRWPKRPGIATCPCCGSNLMLVRQYTSEVPH